MSPAAFHGMLSQVSHQAPHVDHGVSLLFGLLPASWHVKLASAVSTHCELISGSDGSNPGLLPDI